VQGRWTRSPRTGRQYHLFEYVGAPDAERVVVMMGSGCETAEETVNLVGAGEKVGVVKVRLYRPFSVAATSGGAAADGEGIAVLDRTKEPGSAASRSTRTSSRPWRGRWPKATRRSSATRASSAGATACRRRSSRPAMVKGVFDELAKPKPKNHFTVGITTT
jgi:pyruvate-ferredoxin/flavodoxin oxidoreductase